MTSVKEHLHNRGMDTSLYNVAIDEDERIATFYLYNLSGQIVGYEQYRPDCDKTKNNDSKLGRYFKCIIRGRDGVFGLECLDTNKKTIYITEGIFKAAVLHRLGYNAIAVLTSTPKRLKPFFKILKQEYNLIAIGDPDSAGKKLVNLVGNGFQSRLDLDEMPDDEITETLKK